MNTKIAFFYKRTGFREKAFSGESGTAYALYGAPGLVSQGWNVELLMGRTPLWPIRACGGLLRRWAQRHYGISGNFVGVLGDYAKLKKCAAVVAVGHNPGIPLLVLRRLGLRIPPVVYLSTGLVPERVAAAQQLRVGRLLEGCAAILCFGSAEAEALRAGFGVKLDPEFVPFGFPPESFPPEGLAPRESERFFDVISVGADPNREFDLLLPWARHRPDVRVHLIGEAARVPSREDLPPNVSVETDLPLPSVFVRMAQSRIAAIPVRENPYSAGTTFLIHALGARLPVVLSRTGAVRSGYGLDGLSAVRGVPPGDAGAFGKALDELLALPAAERIRLGKEGRTFALRNLNDEPLVRALGAALRRASAGKEDADAGS